MACTEIQRILIVCLYVVGWVVSSNGRASPSSHQNFTKRTDNSNTRNHSLFKLTKSCTNKEQVRLFARVGLFLSMDKNGTVFGVLRQNGQREIFELQSFGPSVVKMKHKATGMYLGMNSKGRVRGQLSPPLKDLHFYQNHEENTFVSFASYFHKNKKNGLQMFLAVKRGGSVRSGRLTRAGQDSVQFVLLYVNIFNANRTL